MGLIVGVTGSLIPMAVIVRGAKKGEWDSHHVTDRAGRLIPFAACIGSLAVGFLILIAGNAPHEMIALAAAELACLIAALAITFGWKFKISMHTMVAAGATVMLMRGLPPLARAAVHRCGLGLLVPRRTRRPHEGRGLHGRGRRRCTWAAVMSRWSVLQ